MGFVILALIAVGLTAAFVLSEAIGGSVSDPVQPTDTMDAAGGDALGLDLIDAPTQAVAISGSDLLDAPTQATIMPAPEAEPVTTVGIPHFRPDPDRLIQTEVLLPSGNDHSVAMTKLAIGIAVSGLGLGLGILGLARGVNFLVRLLS